MVEQKTVVRMKKRKFVTATVTFFLALWIGAGMEALPDAQGIAFTGEFPSPLLDANALMTPGGANIRAALKITNNGSAALRLSTYRSVLPELVDARGQVVPFDYGTNRSRPPDLSDYPLLASGQSLVIRTEATLTLRGAELAWKGSDGIFGFWKVSPASGSYHFRLKYSQQQPTAGPFADGFKSLGEIWTGEGVTDAVTLPLKFSN